MKRSPENIGRLVLRRGPEVAHDIASPLNTILINAGILRAYLESKSTESAAEIDRVAAIEREADRVRQIVETFFDAVAGPLEDESEFDVVVVARGVAERFGARFACDSARMPVMGDEKRTRQIFRSILEGLARSEVGSPELVTMACSDARISLKLHCASAVAPRIFRFAKVDGEGRADTALAGARAMAEALGGTLQHADEKLELIIPLE